MSARALFIYGALLGVVSGLMERDFFGPNPEQHFTTKRFDSDFFYRIRPTSFAQNAVNDRIRAHKLQPGSGTALQCSNTRFTGGPVAGTGAYTVNAISDLFSSFGFPAIQNGNQILAGSDFAADGDFAGQTSFAVTGKYRLCLCGTGNCAQQRTSIQATNAAYRVTVGFLHVVDSFSGVGPNGFFFGANGQSVNPEFHAGPTIYLQARTTTGEHSAVQTQASWLFSKSPADVSSDRFAIVHGFEPALSVSTARVASGSWSYQCGQETRLPADPLLPADLLYIPNITMTKVEDQAICSNANAPAGAGLSGVSGNVDTCFQGPLVSGAPPRAAPDLYLSEPFTPPLLDSSSQILPGYLCYCNAVNEGSCDQTSNYGAALGPVVFRRFTTSEHQRHYTLHAAPAQEITLDAVDGMMYAPQDRFSLVRLDAPQAQPPNRGSWNYGDSFSRSCGWSNLDVHVELENGQVFNNIPVGAGGGLASTYTYQPFITSTPTGTLVPITISSSSATLSFDFSRMHSRKYELCYCDSTVSVVTSNSVVNLCPSATVLPPNTGFNNAANIINNNGQGSHFQLFYSQSQGFIHVVMTFSGSNTNILLQSGGQSSAFFTVNLLSRPASPAPLPVRTSDGEYYASRTDDLKNSRFYLVAEDGTCGVDAASTHPALGGSDIGAYPEYFIRISDTGANSASGLLPVNIGEDQIFNTASRCLEAPFAPAGCPSFSSSPGSFSVSGRRWGALFSMTTGWPEDILKVAGPQIGNNGPDSDGNGAWRDALDITEGAGFRLPIRRGFEVDFGLCFCDNTVEYSPLELSMGENCANSYMRSRDVSRFLKIGNVQVRKFVNNMGLVTDSRHYTVGRPTSAQSEFRLQTGTDLEINRAADARDTVALIPFYGDGYGADRYIREAGTFSIFGGLNPGLNPPNVPSWHPWKTEYFCGQAVPSTIHTFHQFNDPAAADGAPVLVRGLSPFSIREANSAEGPLLRFQSSVLAGLRKYKICYCSFTAFGSACPTGLNDAGSDGSGFGLAFRYSDFAGFVHVVDTPSHPIYQVTPVNNPMDFGFDVDTTISGKFSPTTDRVIFPAFSDFSPCSADEDPTITVTGMVPSRIVSNTGTIATLSGIQSANDVRLSICYCDYVAEALDQVVVNVGAPRGRVFNFESVAAADFTRRTCEAFDQLGLDGAAYYYGSEVGAMALATLVRQSPNFQHFTVLSDSTPQFLTVIKESGAITRDSSVAEPDMIAIIDESDIGDPTQNACGTTAIQAGRVLNIDTTTNLELNTESGDFLQMGLTIHQRYLVCYCQRNNFGANRPCSSSEPGLFYQVGFLHMVDIPAQQNFILPADRGTEFLGIANGDRFDRDPATLILKFNQENSWTPAIVGQGAFVQRDTFAIALDRTLNPQVRTTKCGETPDAGVNLTQFPSTLESGVLALETDNTAARITFRSGTSGLFNSFGASSFGYLCMCDSVEAAKLTTNNRPCFNGLFIPTNSEWDRFGITVGKVWTAGTVTLSGSFPSTAPGGTAGTYFDVLSQPHYSVTRADSTSFTIRRTGPESSHVASVGQGDQVGVLQSGICGYDAPPVITSVTRDTTGENGVVTINSNALISGVNGFIQTDNFFPAFKFEICYCRFAVLNDCSQTFQFFSTVGFLHVVDYDFSRTNLVTQQTSSPFELAVNFTFSTPGRQDRFAFIIAAVGTGNELECGQFSNQGTAFQAVGLADSQFDATVVTDSDFYEYRIVDLDGTNFVQASSIQPRVVRSDATAAGQFTTGLFTTLLMTNLRGDTPATLKICYCSFQSEGGSCPSSQDSGATAEDSIAYYSSFGADLGTVVIAYFLTANFDSQHFTVYSATVGNQVQPVKIEIAAATPIAVSLADRWTFVRSDSETDPDCGAFAVVGSQVLEIVPVSPAVVPNALSICSDPLTNCPNSFTLNVPALNPGKYKVCLCSAQGQSFDRTTCDSSRMRDFSDQAGYIHVLAGPTPSHSRRFVSSVNFEEIQFNFGTHVPSDSDRFAIIDRDLECGDDGFQFGSSYGFIADGVYGVVDSVLSVTITSMLQRSSFTNFPDDAPTFKLCYCDFSIEGQCSNTADFGATAGTFVLNEFTFINGATTSSARSGASSDFQLNIPAGVTVSSRFVNPSVECDAVPTTPTTASATFTDLVAPAPGATWDFSLATASRTPWRLCLYGTVGGLPNQVAEVDTCLVEVTDITVQPSFVQKLPDADVTIDYTESLSDEDLIWFQRSGQSCVKVDQEADVNSTNVLLVGDAGSTTYEFNFGLLDPADPSTDSFRLCTLAPDGTVRDFSNLIIRVYGFLSVAPTSVLPQIDQSLFFLHQDALQLAAGELSYFTRASSCPVNFGPPQDRSDVQLAPANGTTTLWDFSNVSPLNQDLFRLCGQVVVGGIPTQINYSPVGVRVVSVTALPRTVQPRLSSIDISFAGDSLISDQAIWFQLAGTACESEAPLLATASFTNSLLVSQTGATYMFDFSLLSGETRMCVESVPGQILDYGSVNVNVANLTITSSKSVLNQINRAITFEFDKSIFTQGDLWFAKEGSTCAGTSGRLGAPFNPLVSTQPVLIDPSTPSPATIDFQFNGALVTDQDVWSVCFLPVGSTESFDYGSEVGVLVTDLAVEPNAVLEGETSTLIFSYSQASTALNNFDSIALRRSDLPCRSLQEETEDLETSSPVIVGNSDQEQLFLSNDRCPWTELGATVGNDCDYRCPANDILTCLVAEFSFVLTKASQNQFRVCVNTPNPGSRTVDFDSVFIFVIDVEVRPRTARASGPTNFTFDWSPSFITCTGNAASDADDVEGQATFREGDQIWFASEATGCVAKASTDAEASSSSVVEFGSVTNGEPISFTFGTDTGVYILCAGSSTETALIRQYSVTTNVIVHNLFAQFAYRAIDSANAPQFPNTQAGPTILGNAGVDLGGLAQVVDGQENGDGPNSNAGSDVFFFARASISCETAFPSLLNGSSVVDVATGVTTLVPTQGTENQVAQFFFPGDDARVCVLRTHDVTGFDRPMTDGLCDRRGCSEFIDFADVFVIVHDVTLASQAVVGGISTFDINLRGLKAGDQLFLATAPPMTSSIIPPFAPVACIAGFVPTEIFTVPADPVTEITLDFTNFGPIVELCVSRPGALAQGGGDLMSAVNYVGVTSSPVFASALVRPAAGQVIDYQFDLSFGGNDNSFFFSDEEAGCAGALSGPHLHFIATGDYTLPVQLPLSPSLYGVCLATTGGPFADGSGLFYPNFGIIVSDITIQGSSVDNVATTGCVQPSDAQTVSFSMSPDLAFDVDAVLFFRLQGQPCDDVSTSDSNAVQMIGVGADGSFSLEFDFSGASPSVEVYRLCVLQILPRSVLDFAPLGVRVSSVVINAGLTSLRLGQQRIRLTHAGELTNGGQFVFIDAESADVNCECAFANTCPGRVQDPNGFPTIAGRDNSYNIDFNTPLVASPGGVAVAHMCYQPPMTNLPFALTCVTVNFEIPTSPSFLPANEGQLVRIDHQGALTRNDRILFRVPGTPCPGDLINFERTPANEVLYSSVINAGVTGQSSLFNFSGMRTAANTGLRLILCVEDQTNPGVFEMASGLSLTTPVVQLAGDPHVRSSNGEWLDFHGKAGIYQLYKGAHMEANAKLGYAVRENHLIWHPRVMRPGTVVEEVGLKLLGGVSIRLGVYAGGMLSVREFLKPAIFLSSTDTRALEIQGYQISWTPCTEACATEMPWGNHERSYELTVVGHGEYMKLSVSGSGGYRFIDVESTPKSGSSGLLADASQSPLSLAARLKTGAELAYQIEPELLSY